MKKTTFNITKSALGLENLLIEHMDIPRTTFHRRMIDYYLKYDRTINQYLMIKKRRDPNYVKKDAVEQIYLDEKREADLLVIAKQHSTTEKKCGINTMLFQALLTYCVAQAPVILGEKMTDSDL